MDIIRDAVAFAWPYVWPFLTAIGGGLAAIVLTSFTKWGERLIGHRFDAKLEGVKGGLTKEVEKLKSRLGHLADRGIRSNEREYKAIVAAWEAFVEAYLATNSLVYTMDSFPDLDQLDEPARLRFLQSAKVPEASIEFIEGAVDKKEAYSRYLRRKRLNAAEAAIFEARQAVRTQGIFVPRSLEALFIARLERMSRCHVNERANFEGHAAPDLAHWTTDFMEKGATEFDEVKDAARKQLMYDEHPANA